MRRLSVSDIAVPIAVVLATISLFAYVIAIYSSYLEAAVLVASLAVFSATISFTYNAMVRRQYYTYFNRFDMRDEQALAVLSAKLLQFDGSELLTIARKAMKNRLVPANEVERRVRALHEILSSERRLDTATTYRFIEIIMQDTRPGSP